MMQGNPDMAATGPAAAIPVVVTLIMAMLMLLPVGSGAASVVLPHLVMISVFYWASNRPLLMPYGAVAFIGFVLDLWLDVPLGLNMLLLLLARLFVMGQIKYYRGRSRLAYWGVFTLMSVGLYGLSWLIVSLVGGRFWTVAPLAMEWLVTVLAYPLVTLLFSRLRRSLMARSG
ncbi:rod shape-determining protein MreD [Yunchengibacter salinarum]|uniref:rod shape-determining protein MreD n=1 Tax=Yunchengibacter salinarum TaxID=3133399 RepID=UPI0035B691E0